MFEIRIQDVKDTIRMEGLAVDFSQLNDLFSNDYDYEAELEELDII
jgi:hypothetical protein